MLHIKNKFILKNYLTNALFVACITIHAGELCNNRLSITNDQEYQRYITQAQHPVIVKFWAPWCTVCQRINPLFEKISTQQEFADIMFVDINIEAAPQLVEGNDIDIIPTFQFIEHGRKIAPDIIGVKNIDLFAQELENLVRTIFEVDASNDIDAKKNSATAFMQWQNSLFITGKTVSNTLRFWTRNALEKTISCTVYMLDCLKERINAFLC